MRDTQPMGLKYHAFFCCCTLFGSYPMSVVFILSYWKLPWGEFFREKRRVKSEEKRKNKNFSQKQGVGSSEGSLPLGEGSSRLCETDEGWDAVSSMNGRGGGMPRPHEFHTQKQSGVSLPACRGCAGHNPTQGSLFSVPLTSTSFFTAQLSSAGASERAAGPTMLRRRCI